MHISNLFCKICINFLYIIMDSWFTCMNPDSKLHGANMGPNWVLSVSDGPHVGHMKLAIREAYFKGEVCTQHVFDYSHHRVINTPNATVKWSNENDISYKVMNRFRAVKIQFIILKRKPSELYGLCGRIRRPTLLAILWTRFAKLFRRFPS